MTVKKKASEQSTYGDDNIKTLDTIEAIRLRPGMYISAIGPEGCKNIFNEVIGNCTDEKHAGYCDEIIVDIDETVLDNSPFEAAIITRNAKYPDDWQKWTKLAKAKACPGSVDFLNYAYNKGVTVFYITNRTFNERETTIQNLISEKFPLADTNHILFKADVSSKEKRRNLIENEFYIVELIGDNLSDFTNIFDNKSPEARSSESEKIRYEFGKKFIVLPNAMYGDWEKAMYDYSKTLSLKDKAEIRRSYLRDF